MVSASEEKSKDEYRLSVVVSPRTCAALVENRGCVGVPESELETSGQPRLPKGPQDLPLMQTASACFQYTVKASTPSASKFEE